MRRSAIFTWTCRIREIPKLSWYGESVGHYEGGDTLVVDTIAQNDKTFVDDYGTPHTAQLHVIERYKLLDGGRSLQVSFTVDDPGAFNMPWSGMQIYRRSDQGALLEAPCADGLEAARSTTNVPHSPGEDTGFLIRRQIVLFVPSRKGGSDACKIFLCCLHCRAGGARWRWRRRGAAGENLCHSGDIDALIQKAMKDHKPGAAQHN